jgi:hypothetical protein
VLRDFFPKIFFWKNGALVAGMCAVDRAPESQSRVYCQYGLCWWWVRRSCAGVWVGSSVGGWVGVEGDGEWGVN